MAADRAAAMGAEMGAEGIKGDGLKMSVLLGDEKPVAAPKKRFRPSKDRNTPVKMRKPRKKVEGGAKKVKFDNEEKVDAEGEKNVEELRPEVGGSENKTEEVERKENGYVVEGTTGNAAKDSEEKISDGTEVVADANHLDIDTPETLLSTKKVSEKVSIPTSIAASSSTTTLVITEPIAPVTATPKATTFNPRLSPLPASLPAPFPISVFNAINTPAAPLPHRKPLKAPSNTKPINIIFGDLTKGHSPILE